MENWRKIAGEAKDIMTVCLAKVIDRAMTAQLGSAWFELFAQEDSKEKGVRIAKPFQKTVYDLDLQGLLKFMRFRKRWASMVLHFYGFYNGMDEFALEGQRRQLDALLDRLINDFRNHIEAHSRAADIDSALQGQPVERLYGYQEAYNDMVRLVRIFSKDPVGVTYYKRITALVSRKKLWIIGAVSGFAVLAAVLLLLLMPGENVYYNDVPPAVRSGQVSVSPMEVVYEDGQLVAACYVLNGTQETVSEICVYSFLLTVDGKTVAAADFGELEGLKIEAGKTAMWRFRFPKNTVLDPDAELSALRAEVYCTYK